MGGRSNGQFLPPSRLASNNKRKMLLLYKRKKRYRNTRILGSKKETVLLSKKKIRKERKGRGGFLKFNDPPAIFRLLTGGSCEFVEFFLGNLLLLLLLSKGL